MRKYHVSEEIADIDWGTPDSIGDWFVNAFKKTAKNMKHDMVMKHRMVEGETVWAYECPCGFKTDFINSWNKHLEKNDKEKH